MRAYLLIAKLCGAMLLLMVSLGVLGISQMLTISDTNSAYTRLLHEEVARLQTLRTLTAGFFQVNRLCLNAIIQSGGEPPKIGSVQSAHQLASLVPQMELLDNSCAGDGLGFQELKSSVESYALEVAAFFKLLEEGREDEAKEFRLQKLRPRIEQINELLGQIASDSNSSVTLQIQDMTRSSEKLGTAGLLFSFWPFAVIIIALVWTAVVSLRYLATADTSSEIPVR